MTIFNDVENALAPYVGSADAAGAILAVGTIFAAFFGVLIAFGKDVFKGQTGMIILLIVVSFVSAPGVDWFPLWVPFVIIVALAFLYWLRGFERGE